MMKFSISRKYTNTLLGTNESVAAEDIWEITNIIYDYQKKKKKNVGLDKLVRF